MGGRLVSGKRRSVDITPVMEVLHLLAIGARIDLKFKILIDLAPYYLS